MVERQLRGRDIVDPAVLEAMGRVPRHRFIAPALAREAYVDGPLSIGEGQTISQPYIVALMTQLAQVGKSERVLEVGTGSGYQAAVLAELAQEVYTIEILPSLAAAARRALDALGYQNIHFRVGDGYRGWPEGAPFDAIVVTAAPDHVPQPLLDQLEPGGIMVIPVGSWSQDLIQITKTETGIRRKRITPVRFVPMTGEAEKN
jgi:protein-L-isoaspartate(D-aspartate) O-methyltransferase